MAGNLVAPVKDGQIQQTESQTSLAKSKEKKAGYSKDTFLQLLVAEVQNQDPLEPTSNTEWISQYATFSELEAMNNMSSSFDLSRASTLVGKTVVINTTNDAGKALTVQGKVDFVTYEGGQAYLSVNGSLYSMDDLYNVVDTEYMAAFDKVYEWSVKLNKLPAYENLTYDDAEDVDSVWNEYDKMTDYEKTFVAKENADKIEKLHERIEELKKIHEEAEEAKKLEEAEKQKELEEAEKEEAKAPEETGKEETKAPEGTGTEESREPDETRTEEVKEPGTAGNEEVKESENPEENTEV